MSIPSQLETKISALIEDYERETTPKPAQLRQLVAQKKVLPLVWDMGGVLAINAGGDILSFPWDDTSHPTVERDPRVRNVALFQGGVKYPELKALLPTKPDDAHLCPHCGGTGIAPLAAEANVSNIVCYCGGLGWIP